MSTRTSVGLLPNLGGQGGGGPTPLPGHETELLKLLVAEVPWPGEPGVHVGLLRPQRSCPQAHAASRGPQEGLSPPS